MDSKFVFRGLEKYYQDHINNDKPREFMPVNDPEWMKETTYYSDMDYDLAAELGADDGLVEQYGF